MIFQTFLLSIFGIDITMTHLRLNLITFDTQEITIFVVCYILSTTDIKLFLSFFPMITDICSVCRNHNPVLYSFMAYHQICNNNKRTGVTCGAGTA